MNNIFILVADDRLGERNMIHNAITQSAIGNQYTHIDCACAVSIPPKLKNTNPNVAIPVIRDLKAKGQEIHLAFVDMIFDLEFGIETLEGGHKIISELQKEFPLCRIIVASMLFGKVAALYEVNGTQYPAIAKDAPLTSQVKVIHDELQIWTRWFLNSRLDLDERLKIRDAILSDSELQVISEGGSLWNSRSVLSLYPSVLSKSEFLALLVPNLSWSFSEAFGILGLKQLTHLDGKYYTSDLTVLHEKVRQQLRTLDVITQSVKMLFPTIGAKLERADVEAAPKNSIIEHFEQFKEIYGQSDTVIFSGALQSLREKYFQFKGSDGIGPQTMVEACERLLSDLQNSGEISDGGLQVLQLDDCRGSEVFEVNLPIHEILNDGLAEMFKRVFPNPSGKSASVKICQVFSTARHVRRERVDGYEVRLSDNYLVFRHAVELPSTPDAWMKPTGQPQWIASIQAVMPFLGQLYVMSRADLNSDFNIFNCTYWPAEQLGTFQKWVSAIEAETMRCMVESDHVNKTYYVFSFPAWRQ